MKETITKKDIISNGKVNYDLIFLNINNDKYNSKNKIEKLKIKLRDVKKEEFLNNILYLLLNNINYKKKHFINISKIYNNLFYNDNNGNMGDDLYIFLMNMNIEKITNLLNSIISKKILFFKLKIFNEKKYEDLLKGVKNKTEIKNKANLSENVKNISLMSYLDDLLEQIKKDSKDEKIEIKEEQQQENEEIKEKDNGLYEIIEKTVSILSDENDLVKIKEHLEDIENNGEKKTKSLYYKKIESQSNKKMIQNINFFEKIKDLKNNFPNFIELIEFIEDEIMVNEISIKYFKLPPILIHGEPGIGKTMFLTELNEIITGHDSAKTFINLSAMSTGSILSGLSDYWSGANVGAITSILINDEYINPLVILDEIDKVQSSSSSNANNTLLNMLESHTAKNFKDECLELNINLSFVSFIATANDITLMPSPILNRFTVFKIKEPNLNERKILTKRIFAKILKNKDISEYISDLSEETLNKICGSESKGRDLVKTINTSISRAYKREGINDNKKINILPEDIINFTAKQKQKMGF